MSDNNKGTIQQKLMLEEYKTLKDYLKELRGCQTTFLWSSVTTVGAILAFAFRFSGENSSTTGLCIGSVISLFILCPMCCIWFDKASSVTRVASYIRVLEGMILYGFNENNEYVYDYVYIGWENSYRAFREHANIGASWPKSFLRSTMKPFHALWIAGHFKQPNQYSILNWVAFSALSSLMFVFSLYCLPKSDKLPDLPLLSSFNRCIPHDVVVLSLFVVWCVPLVYSSYILVEISDTNSRSLTIREAIWKHLLDKKNIDSTNTIKVSKFIAKTEKEISKQLKKHLKPPE